MKYETILEISIDVDNYWIQANLLLYRFNLQKWELKAALKMLKVGISLFFDFL